MARSPDSQERFARFCGSFAEHGLVVLGGLRISRSDCPDDFLIHEGAPALLIGNRGRDMWEHFSRSQEYLSGTADPLDSWTIRKLREVSAGEVCSIFHPSIKPCWPFQQIAGKVTGVAPSPLGILIHPEFGLWHGLRGLLVFDPTHDFANHINALAALVPETVNVQLKLTLYFHLKLTHRFCTQAPGRSALQLQDRPGAFSDQD